MAKTLVQTKLIIRNEQSEFVDDLNSLVSSIDHESLVDIKFQQLSNNAFSGLVLYRTGK